MAFEHKFIKYSATGNDFLVVDNRLGAFNHWDLSKRQQLCHRQLGVGADGILFLEKPNNNNADYRMRYFNSDGGECSMCGNGARALGLFAKMEARLTSKNPQHYLFETQNGLYQISVNDQNEVSLLMTELKDINLIDVKDLFPSPKYFYMNSGVPHSVFLVDKVDCIDVPLIAPRLAHNKIFSEGSNINFFEKLANRKIKMRTFERGVEGETLSCGTGIVATAYFCHLEWGWRGDIQVKCRGGEVIVKIKSKDEVYFCGKVQKIFMGQLES